MIDPQAEKPSVVVELDRCTCEHCDRAESELRRLCDRFGAVLRVTRVDSQEATKQLAGWKTPLVYLNGRLLSTFSTPVKKWEKAIREKIADAEFSISGEVIDLECHLKHEHRGEKHAECAKTCLARGEPAGLLTRNEQVFLLLADESQRKTLAQLAAAEIEIRGEVFRKGGVQSIVVHSIA
jgi:hypothetical protein